MFLEERYEKILDKINQNGRVMVKELAKEFDLTEDCIRKDLKELEGRGALKRVYGGAIPKRLNNDIKPIKERCNVNSEKKETIAKNVIKLIEDRDIVFLDISTINLEVAKLLRDTEKNLIVVTNMIEIMLELKGNSKIKLISVGGEINNDVGGIVGAAADRYIKQFSYSKAFMGVCGINIENGNISTVNLEDGNTKKTIMECSLNSYLVMESEKFNRDEFFNFATVDDINLIITEEGFDKLD